jgi:tubulin alpha
MVTVMQVFDADWQLYCLERDIPPDGQMATGKSSVFNFYDLASFVYSPTQYVPRATFIDLEPIVFDKEVRCSMCTVQLCTLLCAK